MEDSGCADDYGDDSHRFWKRFLCAGREAVSRSAHPPAAQRAGAMSYTERVDGALAAMEACFAQLDDPQMTSVPGRGLRIALQISGFSPGVGKSRGEAAHSHSDRASGVAFSPLDIIWTSEGCCRGGCC